MTADAEDLSFPDGELDVVLSTYGVMFAPDQKRAAGEMHRVTKSGGRIGLANGTPDGFIGQLFRVIGRFVARSLRTFDRGGSRGLVVPGDYLEVVIQRA